MPVRKRPKRYETTRIDAANTVITTYVNMILQESQRKIRVSDEEREEAIQRITKAKYTAWVLDVPFWKVADMLIAYGLNAFWEKNIDLMRAKINHRRKLLGLAEEIVDIYDSEDGDLVLQHTMYQQEQNLINMIADGKG